MPSPPPQQSLHLQLQPGVNNLAELRGSSNRWTLSPVQAVFIQLQQKPSKVE